MAKGYAKQKISDEESYQKKLEKTREYFRPDMDVFEFGCGTGSTAIAHAPYVRHIHATDLSSSMIAIATEKGKAANIENIKFEQLEIDGFTPTPKSYDAVMAHSILHLLEDRNVAIKTAYKMLKPGGLFISSTICLSDFKGLLVKALICIAPIGRVLTLLPLIRKISAGALEQSMIDAGFVVEHRWTPGQNKALFLIVKKPE